MCNMYVFFPSTYHHVLYHVFAILWVPVPIFFPPSLTFLECVCVCVPAYYYCVYVCAYIP